MSKQICRISKEKPSLFVLEYKFFDKLTDVRDIALYAFLLRIEGTPSSNQLIMQALNLSQEQFDKSINKLIEIGFLELNKDV